MMTRKELAQKVFTLLKHRNIRLNEKILWRMIAETDDNSLLEEYEKLRKDDET